MNKKGRVEFNPVSCPKCESDLQLIPGQKDAWKCICCGLEIWDGDVPTKEEYEEMVHSASSLGPLYTYQRPSISLAFCGVIKKKGGSKSGRKRKKKRPFRRNYYIDK